ncbi:hypothetical protein FRC02_009149 [Tulasnella sp. 418]|nr:hypothetical protein FRC02_009149 [Tulasnella sp. 418]
MLYKIIVTSLYIAGALAAPRSEPVRVCGTNPTREEIDIAESRLATAQARLPTDSGAKVVQSITIPVYWHVLSSGDCEIFSAARSKDETDKIIIAPSQGNVPDEQITDSITVMNEQYAPTGFVFQLTGTDRTSNAIWYNGLYEKTPVEAEAKGALRQGGANALNVYTVSFTTNPILGYTTMPADYQNFPTLDGVVIDYTTLPGGTGAPYNLVHEKSGMTLVHETGHWLGLYHTFEGGCTGDGDMVDDTPAQLSQTTGCPIGRDSCPGGGPDPIHNFMDYSNDSCMNEFTPGQSARMKAVYASFRAA